MATGPENIDRVECGLGKVDQAWASPNKIKPVAILGPHVSLIVNGKITPK